MDQSPKEVPKMGIAETRTAVEHGVDLIHEIPPGTTIFGFVSVWVLGWLAYRKKNSKTKLGEAADDATVAQIKSLTAERDTAVEDARAAWQRLLSGAERLGQLQQAVDSLEKEAKTREEELGRARQDVKDCRMELGEAREEVQKIMEFIAAFLPREALDLLNSKVYRVKDITTEVLNERGQVATDWAARIAGDRQDDNG